MTTTLAQVTGPDAAAIPALPPAPFYQSWIFESPLALTLGLSTLGILTVFALLRAGKRGPAGIAGAIALVLAAGTLAAGHLVTTPREVITQDTALLIDATAIADAAGMNAKLHPDAALRRGSYRFIPEVEGRDAIVSAGKQLPGLVGRVSILETRAGLDGPRVGRSQARLRVYSPEGQILGHSWWGIDWQQHDGAWVATAITPLWIQLNG